MKNKELNGIHLLAIVIFLASVIVAGSVVYTGGVISSSGLRYISSTADSVAPTPTPTIDTYVANNEEINEPESLEKKNINITGKPIRGFENATVTIVEFGDFECSFCAKATSTLKQILDDYKGQVRLIYKHFPLSFHSYAQKAAEAYECAVDQGKGWEYYDVLFNNTRTLDVDSIKKYAVDLGLDDKIFNACLDNGEKEAIVKADLIEGTSLGVQGTPTFFINGIPVVGALPYSAFKQVIDQELNSEEMR